MILAWEKFSGWCRSISSRRGLTVQELKSEYRSDLPSPLLCGSSNAGASCGLTPENLARQYSTTLAIHFATVCQLRIDLGPLTARNKTSPEASEAFQYECALAASQLSKAADLHAQIAACLFQLSRELWQKKKARCAKLLPKKSRPVALDKRWVARQRLRNSPNSGESGGITPPNDGPST